jgi:hypothetical protein
MSVSGQGLGPYRVLDKLGEGGPPPFAPNVGPRTMASLAEAEQSTAHECEGVVSRLPAEW